jgi:hypothetical protein
MTYTRDDPKWVQAEEVTQTAPGYVTVTAYGETFENCKSHDDNNSFNESYVLVEMKTKPSYWLHVWFYDADVQAVDRP